MSWCMENTGGCSISGGEYEAEIQTVRGALSQPTVLTKLTILQCYRQWEEVSAVVETWAISVVCGWKEFVLAALQPEFDMGPQLCLTLCLCGSPAYIYMYVSVRECVQIVLRTWIDSVEYYGLLNAGQRQHTNRVVTEGRPAPHTRPPAAQSMPMHRRIIQSCTEHFVVAIKATRLMITIAKRNKIVWLFLEMKSANSPESFGPVFLQENKTKQWIDIWQKWSRQGCYGGCEWLVRQYWRKTRGVCNITYAYTWLVFLFVLKIGATHQKSVRFSGFCSALRKPAEVILARPDCDWLDPRVTASHWPNAEIAPLYASVPRISSEVQKAEAEAEVEAEAGRGHARDVQDNGTDHIVQTLSRWQLYCPLLNSINVIWRAEILLLRTPALAWRRSHTRGGRWNRKVGGHIPPRIPEVLYVPYEVQNNRHRVQDGIHTKSIYI